MSSIAAKLQQVSGRIAQACAAAQRPVQSVTLLAVSKTQSATAVLEAWAAGQSAFGENYVQEALPKMDAVAAKLGPHAKPGAPAVRAGGLSWHLIGPLQANKTRQVAEAFDWVHTIDRLKVAERLSAQRPAWLSPLQLCIQVNLAQERSKSGVAIADVEALAQALAALPRLSLRGLMSIPEPTEDSAEQRRQHRALAQLMAEINRRTGLGLDTLSMGMSADLEAAVAEGSTLVRVGSAIFGARPPGA